MASPALVFGELRCRSAVGPGDATDSRIFDHAVDNGLIVLTSDLDFGAILSSMGAKKPSVVQIRGQFVWPKAIGSIVLDAITQSSEDLTRGALVTINPKRDRISILPLKRSG